MGNFFGVYRRNIDEKFRLPLPSRLTGETRPVAYYALKGLDGCLSVYPKDDFDRELERLRKAEWSDPRQRAYVRLALASAVELPLDSRSRLLIPAEVGKAYSLSGETVILGALDHFEVWSKASYEAYMEKNLASYEDLATSLPDTKGE